MNAFYLFSFFTVYSLCNFIYIYTYNIAYCLTIFVRWKQNTSLFTGKYNLRKTKAISSILSRAETSRQWLCGLIQFWRWFYDVWHFISGQQLFGIYNLKEQYRNENFKGICCGFMEENITIRKMFSQSSEISSNITLDVWLLHMTKIPCYVMITFLDTFLKDQWDM